MGVVTDISFTKGGSDDLWSTSGLPLQMDVNVTVKDLYPAMMMSFNPKELATNIGLMDWVDNLAGIDIQKFTPVDQAWSFLVHKLRIFANTKAYIETKAADAVGSLLQTAQERFRRSVLGW